MFSFLIALCALGAVILLWLFLIAPRAKRNRPDCAALTNRLYAHRGLHGAGVPENSLPAFRLAVQGGYGIELDVRLAKDGALVLFHDETLERLCGEKGGAEDYMLPELKRMRLLGTDETLPTFSEALGAIGGRVPLIVELKSMTRDTRLAQRAADTLNGYQGAYCVESFNPFQLRWFKKHRPDVVRGQLSGDMRAWAQGRAALQIMAALLKGLFVNALSRPDFIAYEFGRDSGPGCRALRALFGPLWAGWTFKTEEALQTYKSRYAMWIFEGFEPTPGAPQDRKETNLK